MTRLYKILIIVFAISSMVFSQEHIFNKTLVEDSLEINSYQNPLLEFHAKFDEFELHRDLYNIQASVLLDGDKETIWLRTSVLLSQGCNNEDKAPDNLLSPLLNQYLESSKFNPLRTILGMAQAGAVGYLAYKHLKKYGFLK